MSIQPVSATGPLHSKSMFPKVSSVSVGSGTSAVMTSWIYGSRAPEIKPIWVCVSGTSYIEYRIYNARWGWKFDPMVCQSSYSVSTEIHLFDILDFYEIPICF